MMDSEKFSHDKSVYERPNSKYVCGRSGDWGKPCTTGPNRDGTCGGAVEAGEPPCVPRRSLRRLRGHCSVVLFGIILAFLVASIGIPDGIVDTTFSGLDAGPITGAHLNFTGPRSQGCTACHAPHAESGLSWLAAVFTDTDMTGKCLDCHSFSGPPRIAHNQATAATQLVRETDCAMCHGEHKGINADISALSDKQCATCHVKKFDKFDQGHPQYDERFPYYLRPSIKFDHTSHLKKHFLEDKFLVTKGESKYNPVVPESCISCHDQENATRRVTPLPYEKVCKECHSKEIEARELVVLNLPHLTERAANLDDIIEDCGPPIHIINDLKEEEEEEFSSISDQDLNSITSYMLGSDPHSIEEYDELYRELLNSGISQGEFRAYEFSDSRVSESQSKALFSGLNPEVIKRLACSWASNMEYELPMEPSFRGWFGDFTELKYRPLGHADPVMRSWIDFGVSAVATATSAEEKERALNMRDTLLSSKDGPGACMKCHSVGPKNGVLAVNWNYEQTSPDRPHHWYSHTKHPLVEARRRQTQKIDVGPISEANSKPGCATCHQLNEAADFRANFEISADPSSYEGNFSPISKKTCTACHSEGRVSQDCQLCHRYHIEPGFNMEMVFRTPKWHEIRDRRAISGFGE